MNTTTAVALAIFIVTYILLFAIEKARPYIALASAFIFVIIGTAHLLDYSYSPLEALAEVDWNEITVELETITKELSAVDWEKLSTDIGDTALQAQESLRVAGEAVDALDIKTLNEAISDLKTIIEPLAKLFGKTPG